MSTYVIGGQKGGTGKSTLATNLAVALQRAGRRPLLVDADRQATATRWSDRRQADSSLSPVTAIQRTGKLYQALVDLAEHYDDLIVDVCGHNSVELRTAIVAADHLYSPVRASQADLETLGMMTEMVLEARELNPSLQAHLVLSMAPTHPGVSDTRDALELLAHFPAFEVCKTVIRDRKIFRDALFLGKGVLELGDLKANAEMTAIAEELLGHAEVRAAANG